MKIITLAITLGAVMTLHAQTAQERWTLSQCIDHALQHNISIKQQDIAMHQKQLDLNTSRNSRLPNLNASASQNWSFGRGLTADNTYTNKNTASTSLSLGASVPLFTGFRISYTIDQNRLNLEAATADLAKARNDITVQVAKAYMQILYDMEQCDIAERQIAIDSMQVERLSEMVKNGKASGAQLAQQKATLAQSRSTAIQCKNSRQLAVLDLSQLLELPSPNGFDIERPDTATITPDTSDNNPPSPTAIYEESVAFRPEIKAETLRLKGAETGIKIAQSALYPTLSLDAGLGSNYYKTSGYDAGSFGRQMKNNFSQYVGFSLNIPIFNRLETRNNIKTARLNKEVQTLQLENTKKALYKEIQQAYYNRTTAKAKYQSSLEAVGSSKTAFDMVAAKYEYGKANITEFNEAKNNYLKSCSDCATAKYEYLYASALLDFYRGKPLTLQP